MIQRSWKIWTNFMCPLGLFSLARSRIDISVRNRALLTNLWSGHSRLVWTINKFSGRTCNYLTLSHACNNTFLNEVLAMYIPSYIPQYIQRRKVTGITHQHRCSWSQEYQHMIFITMKNIMTMEKYCPCI